MKSSSTVLIVSFIILVVILVFNSVKINIEFFVCPETNKLPNCEYEEDVSILYLNPPEISTKHPNIDPIKGIEKWKQTKYNCDPDTLDCQYDLQPYTLAPSKA